MKRMTVQVLECRRCEHKWIPRKVEEPKLCPNPKCHSPHWKQERSDANINRRAESEMEGRG